MLGLTTLGAFHTAIGLVAVVCGFIALARDKQIASQTRLGQVYLVTTLITAVTALGIFRRGGFGPPHVLPLLTILALGIGTAAGRSPLFGWASRYVHAISYSSTILFHIPGGDGVVGSLTTGRTVGRLATSTWCPPSSRPA